MAITGTFVADFQSFYDAVQKAEVKLKTFEEGSAKAEAQLNRMTNSLSGTKLIQDATLMAEAVERAGGVATLTEKQLASVGRTATEAIEKLKALGQEVPTDLRKIADASKAADDAQGGFLSRIKESAAGYVAGMVTLQAFEAAGRKVIDFFKDSIAQASEAEATQKRLTIAMENQGSALPALVKEYDELSKATAKQTTFSDNAIKELEVLLIQVGNVMPSQIKIAVTATTDLASAMGIDLAQAGSLMAKAAEGNTAALKKMGIELDEARVKGEGLEYVAAQIEQRFGGQAQAELETYSGQVKQLGKQWDETKESVGRFILQSGLLQNGLKNLSNEFGFLNAITSGNRTEFGLFMAEWAQSITGSTKLRDAINLANKALEEHEAQIKRNGSQYATAAQHSDNLIANQKAEALATEAKAEADKKAAAAAKVHSDAVAELATFSQNYRSIVDSIAPSIVEEVKGYLAAGAAAKTLQEVYYLTEGQIKAITMARAADIEMSKRQNQANEDLVRADQQALQLSTKLWQEYYGIKSSLSGTSADQQIDAINRWAANEAAQFEASKQRLNMSANNVAEFYDALAAATAAKLNKIGVDTAALTDAATKHSQAGLQQTADAAQRTYEIAKQHVGEWSDATIEKFRLTAEAAQRAANDFGLGFAQALDPVPAKVDKITDSAKRATDAIKEMVQVWTLPNLTPDQQRAQFEQSREDERINAQRGHLQMPSLFAAAPGIDPREWIMPHFANGGPTKEGPAYVHDDEYVVPKNGALVMSGGNRATTVTIAPGAFVFNYPIIEGSAERIVRLVSDGVLAQLRAEG